jgi:hypothetical protein
VEETCKLRLVLFACAIQLRRISPSHQRHLVGCKMLATMSGRASSKVTLREFPGCWVACEPVGGFLLPHCFTCVDTQVFVQKTNEVFALLNPSGGVPSTGPGLCPGGRVWRRSSCSVFAPSAAANYQGLKVLDSWRVSPGGLIGGITHARIHTSNLPHDSREFGG